MTMPILSSREPFQRSLKTVERDGKQMFADMARELAGMVTGYAGADGKIAPENEDIVRQEARAIVMKYFVRERRVSMSEMATEAGRLNALLLAARQSLRGASEREKTAIKGRIQQLSRRITALQRDGIIYESINAKGEAVSPYARMLTKGIRGIISDVINMHRDYVRKVIQRGESEA